MLRVLRKVQTTAWGSQKGIRIEPSRVWRPIPVILCTLRLKQEEPNTDNSDPVSKKKRNKKKVGDV